MQGRGVVRAKAPLRLSFAGGGTDVPPFPALEGGAVLSATITRYTFASLRPRADRQVSVTSLDFDREVQFGVDDPLNLDGDLDLPKAAVHRMIDRDAAGFDLFLTSNVPPGSGLGSSSSMMVALVGLLQEHYGLTLTDYEIAGMAAALEREDLGIQRAEEERARTCEHERTPERSHPVRSSSVIAHSGSGSALPSVASSSWTARCKMRCALKAALFR